MWSTTHLGTTASAIYALLYSYRLRSGHDKALRDAHLVQGNFSRAGKMGAYLVDLFPSLNHLPRALAPWKAEGDALFKMEADMHTKNFEKGLANPGWNLCKQFRDSCEASGVSAFETAWTIGDVGLAGLDTSAIILEWFVVACVAHGKRFVATARRALDDVVGCERLPTYEDRPRLVYIDAIGKYRPTLFSPQAIRRSLFFHISIILSVLFPWSFHLIPPYLPRWY